MSDSPKKSNRRRRRRPRRRTKPTQKTTQAADFKADEPSAGKIKSKDGQQRSRPQRRRKQQRGGSDLIVQQHDKASLNVSQINKDIFIYTYTLRPQSLLDDYQVGQSVVENMEFEDAGSGNNLIS